MTKARPARRQAGHRKRRRARRPGDTPRYGLLLLALIVNYLLSAFTSRVPVADLQVGLFAVVLFLALRATPLPGRWQVTVAVTAVAGSAVVIATLLVSARTGAGLADLWKALMMALTAVLVVQRVLARPTVTIQSIFGAVSAYLIIGLMFAAGYSAIDHLSEPDFFASQQPANGQTFQYFSFTTLTTLGYGDFTAAQNGGRALAVIEALTGQVFLATLVARLVAAYRPARRTGPPRRRPPRRPRSGAAGHRGRPRAHRGPTRRRDQG